MTTKPSLPGPITSERQGSRARGWVLTWNVARAVICLLVVIATMDQGRLAIAAADSIGLSESTAVFRLFCFFTVQSNVMAAVVLGWASFRGFAGRHRIDSPALALALVSVTSYMLVTGLVYNIVLRSAGDAGIMLGWSNAVHHVIVPAFMLLDVLLAPGRRALPWRAVYAIILYPLIWVSCSLIAGPHLKSPSTGTTPWYPYPFLDASVLPGGYFGVFAWVVGIAVVFAAVGVAAVFVGRLRNRHLRP